MAEKREADVMSMELVIQRELSYRKRVASHLSKEETASLLPLKATNEKTNHDQASEVGKDGWKLVRIKQEGEDGIPSLTSDQVSLPASLNGPKDRTVAEKGKGVQQPSSTFRQTHFPGKISNSQPIPGCIGPYSISNRTIAAANATVQHSRTFKNPDPRPKPGCNGSHSISSQTIAAANGAVQPSRTFRIPDPRSIHVAGQSFISPPKPGCYGPNSISSPTIVAANGTVQPSRTFRNPDPRPTHVAGPSSICPPKPGCNGPHSISSQTIAAANGVPISVPDLKPSTMPSWKKGAPFHSGPPGKATTICRSSHNNFPEPTPQHQCVPCNSHDFFCHICKVDCTTPFNYKQHLKGHKHRAKLRYNQMSKGSTANPSKMPRCELCEIWCTDEKSLQLHLHGRNHQVKLLDVQLGMKQYAAEQQIGKDHGSCLLS